jgi:CRP-like cAMP-binding protein
MEKFSTCSKSSGKFLIVQTHQFRHVTIVLYFDKDYLDRKNIIDYNISVFRESFVKIVEEMKNAGQRAVRA